MPRLGNAQSLSGAVRRTFESAGAAHCVRAMLVTTGDRQFALSQLKEIAAQGVPLFHYTPAHRREFDRDRLTWRTIGGESDNRLSLLRAARDATRNGPAVYVFEEILPALSDRQRADLRLELADQLAEHSAPAVLLFLEPPGAEEHLPGIVRDQILCFQVPYPRREDLIGVARRELAAIASARGKLDVARIRDLAPEFAARLVGQTESRARAAIRDALARDADDIGDAFQHLEASRKELLQHELQMEVLDPDPEPPIGLESLLAYIDLHRDAIGKPGRDRTRGVLLVGPPGTGKTMLARHVGHRIAMPVVNFRVAALMNSYVGATERNFARAFDTLEALSPVVCFIDEIDTLFGDGGENDGGTMRRTAGAMLNWMSECEQPVFIMGATNNLQRMRDFGLALTRSGRINRIFFADVPGMAARQAMLARWLKGRVVGDPAALAHAAAAASDRFSGADLFTVVSEALAAAPDQPLDRDRLLAEIERRRLRASGIYEEFASLRRWAELWCEPAGSAN
ncbi:MAG: ATP-binding protein [Stellaceae bacterium]